MTTPTERVYELLVDPDEELATADLDPGTEHALPGNALRQVGAMALQKAGDLLTDPKTVLTWLVVQVGAPSAVIGMLVPVREAGALLPQTAVARFARRRAVRKWLWVLGAVGQAAAVGAIAIIALLLDGVAAGWAVLAALACFALARSVSSLASKDVLGRTIPKGARGRVTGAATVASGIVAISLGAWLRLAGGDDTPVATLALLLGAAALAWVAAAGIYATIVEAPSSPEPADRRAPGALRLLADDAVFRRFVLARGLLLVSALSPPFVVSLAAESGAEGLAGLGPFMMGSGLAALVGGRFWGRRADRSSRKTMMLAAGLSSALVVAFVIGLRSDAIRENEIVYPLVYLALALVHTGSRIGRKTYVIDLAEGNERTDRVAVANAAMGVILLGTGALTAAVATFGVPAALLTLALLGVGGVLVSHALPELTEAR